MNASKTPSNAISIDLDEHPNDELLTTITSAIAKASGKSALELRPLAWYLDPEALVELLDAENTQQRAHPRISFDYEGYRIHIEWDGTLELMEL